MRRSSRRKRKTRETQIQLQLDLDGKGRARINLQDRWLRHMLESLCKFSGFDLTVKGKGDLLHHTNEDVAITLGRALRSAIDKRSIRRLGSATVAMDDALALVSVDLVDRPFYDSELPDTMLCQTVIQLPMNTTYWEGWPSCDNEYIHEGFWHKSAMLMWIKLDPTQA